MSFLTKPRMETSNLLYSAGLITIISNPLFCVLRIKLLNTMMRARLEVPDLYRKSPERDHASFAALMRQAIACACPRQDNNSRESKVTRVAFNTCKKVPIAFGDQQFSERHGAMQCSAGQSGTDAMVPLVPWPVPQEQRLDSRQSPLGCLAARKKKTKNIYAPYLYQKYQKKLPTFFAESQYYMYDECAGNVRPLRWIMRQWTPRDTDAMKSPTRVHHCPVHVLFRQTPIPLYAQE